MRKILQKDNPKLRERSRKVSLEEINSPYVKSVISDMKEAMQNEDDSAAIAAPQIGELVRIFIISKSVVPKKNDEEKHDLVFINPKIIKHSQSKSVVEEGCLSVRWLYGEVNRYEKVTIEALDEQGARVVYGASGIIAQAFQHEIDHLNGVLFIDKATNIRDIPPEDTHHE
ncbi:MAG: peptide deformylase [Candidatus Paceibacterota bacterium]